MKIHKKASSMLAAAVTKFLLLEVAPSASAAVGGESSVAIHGGANIPRDGVVYPVVRWKNFYRVPAAEPRALTPGVTNMLTTTNAREETNTVAGTRQRSVTVAWAVPLLSKIISGAESGWVFSETYSHLKTVTFSTTDTISIVPKIDNLIATPVYYRMQATGSKYVWDDLSGAPRMKGGDIHIDIVVMKKWEIKRSDGTAAIPGTDY